MEFKDAVVNIDAPYESSKPRVTVTETEINTPQESLNSYARPQMMNRRGTAVTLRGSGDETLTVVGRVLYKALENPVFRYAIYVLPVAGLLAIPLALFATKYDYVKADGIHLFGLFVWIEIIWVFLWVSKLIAASFPIVFQCICSLVSTGVRKYAIVLKAVEIPISLFIWTLFSLGWFDIIHYWDKAEYNRRYFQDTDNIQWLHLLKNVIRGSIASAALYVGEKILMQMISVSYYGHQYADKIKEIKSITYAVDHLYEASLKVYHDHHPDFVEEDYVIHDSTNVQKFLKQYSADRTTLRVFGDIHYYGEKIISVFGRMASDLTGSQVLRPTSTHAVVENALARKAGAEALARRIFKSLIKPGQCAITEQDIVEELGPGMEHEANVIFHELDRDSNGDVSLEEMIMLVTSIAKTRKAMMKSAVDIRDAIKVLDRVLSVIILVVIGLIYSAFFSSFVADNWTKILGILCAGAFSFGQTVGEFNAACILVFVKHPFDVGDRVNIGDIQYEVQKISLLYTVFKRIDTETIVQVANSVVGNLWTDNITRSKAMKERLQFSVSAGTTFSDIETLRAELEAFVKAPENCRDYQPEVDIELISVGDLKQLDLRVEIRHKHNWSDEKRRAYRRSKFMCALLSAMRKVPIDGPAGSAPERGSINNPNYSVAITNDIAKETRAHFDKEKDAKRMKPQEIEELPSNEKQTSTGLEILPSLRLVKYDEAGMMIRRPSVHGQQR